MTPDIAVYNLERDRKVLGKEWLSTYGGWFSDKENIRLFIDAVQPVLPDKELRILYAASASGLLGEALLRHLGRGTLTLVDMSQAHLNENKNPLTEKICADLVGLHLGKEFDVVMMRSSLDYFPSRLLQIDVLQTVRRHLASGGQFINQPAYISDPHERDIISAIYTRCDKLGSRFFQSSDLSSLYTEADFKTPRKIGASNPLTITEQDHMQRYDLTKDDVSLIQKSLREAGYDALVTNSGYTLTFEFPIYIAEILES